MKQKDMAFSYMDTFFSRSKLSHDLIWGRKVLWDCQNNQERNARGHRPWDTRTIQPEQGVDYHAQYTCRK